MLFFTLQVLLFAIMADESLGCFVPGTGLPGCGRSLEEREVICLIIQDFAVISITALMNLIIFIVWRHGIGTLDFWSML